MKDKIEFIASKRGYVVSEEGELFNPKGKIIGVIKTSGYRGSMIRVNGKKTWITNHRLQAFQKYGNKLFEEGIMVRHKDGNPLNNYWENILIGTQSDNMMDVPEQIRIKRAKHATSFWKKHDKDKIKKFHNSSNSYRETMKEFGITSKGTLHYILNN